MKNQTTHIIIVDDLLPENDPVVVKLKQEYENVKVINSPEDGLKFISDHLSKKMIVVLDYKFAVGEPDGAVVLEKIRAASKLIPVIMWTANGNQIAEFESFVNNRAYAFVHKGNYPDLLKKINGANEELESSLEGALEEWIKIQEQTNGDKPFLINADGKQFTLADMLKELRQQTAFGQKLEKDLLMLTIDLLIRNKESLK